MIELPNLKDRAFAAGGFLLYCGERFLRDGGPRAAAALSYSSLLALVPLFAIAFAVLSAFDAFEDLRVDLQLKLFESMLPDTALAVSDYFAEFVTNARRMTGAGVIGLAVTAVLLLNTVTGAFASIWHDSEARPLALRLLVYWALLTLGPLLLGASISLSTYAFAAARWVGLEGYASSLFSLPWLLPFLLATAGLTLLFIVVPQRSVQLRHALAGAAVAAFLMELLKKAFGLYLAYFPAYQAIYGALAAIPIFLVWMYLSWAVLLVGAEIAAALPEWRAARVRDGAAKRAGATLALALTILERLRQAARKGRVVHESALWRGLPATLEELDGVLSALRRGRYVTQSGGSRWVLSRDLSAVSLNDLIAALGLSLDPGEGWPENVTAAVGRVSEAGGEPGARSIDEVLEATPAETALRLGRLA